MLSNTWKSEFVYDGMGRLRIQRDYTYSNTAWVKTNESRYIYDGWLIVQERDENNVPKVTYTRGPDVSGSRSGAGGIGGLLARTDHFLNRTDFYQSDAHGNIVAMIDEHERLSAKYLWDPFGNLLGQLGVAFTVTFCGRN